MRWARAEIIFANFILSNAYSKGGRDVDAFNKSARGCNTFAFNRMVGQFALTSHGAVGFSPIYFYGWSFNCGCYDKECSVPLC